MITRALGLALVVALTTAAAPKPLDVSGPKPAWVSADDDTYTQAGKVYFRTVVDRQKRLDVAVQRAKFLGVRAIRDSVELEVATAFGETLAAGSNDVDDPGEAGTGGVRAEINAIAKALPLPGIMQESSYWEKTEVTLADGRKTPAYKVLVLTSIPKKALNQARKAAAQAALPVAKQARNAAAQKALAEVAGEDGQPE